MECYLDNSATTAVSPEAAALALHIMTEEYGNPSSLHRRGFLAERAMTEARGQVAAVLHCRPVPAAVKTARTNCVCAFHAPLCHCPPEHPAFFPV